MKIAIIGDGDGSITRAILEAQANGVIPTTVIPVGISAAALGQGVQLPVSRAVSRDFGVLSPLRGDGTGRPLSGEDFWEDPDFLKGVSPSSVKPDEEF